MENIPENLQDSEMYQKMEIVSDAIDSAIEKITDMLEDLFVAIE